MREYYLDNSATTKLNDEVLEKMIYAYQNMYGNPSSLHSIGLRTEKILNSSKSIIANFISADKSKIIFTSGGTESNNIVMSSFLKSSKKNQNIVISEFEHPSVYESAFQKYLSETEIRVVRIGRDGYIDFDDYMSKIDENTIFVSIMLVNNEIGTVQDIEKLSKAARKKNPNLYFHTDAVQAYGKIEINVKKLGVDFMTFSSHKINGPQGVGGLYVKNKSLLIPLSYGGKQENGIRPGTENVVGIYGFGEATRIVAHEFDVYTTGLKEIRDDFENKIKKSVDNIIINSQIENAAPHILNITFKGIRAEILLHYLEMDNIYISTGTTCSSKAKKENRVLTSIGLDGADIQATVRISFGANNKLEDNEYLVKKLSSRVDEIRKIMK